LQEFETVSKDYNYRKGLIILSISSLFFIVVGIIIASSLSLPGKIGAEQPQQAAVITHADYQLPVASDGHSPFVGVAANVKDAVVNISAESIKEGSSFHDFMPDDEFFRKYFGIPEDREGRTQKRRSQSLGSGFIISSDGFILTNNHVVQGADKITIRLSDASEYPAEVIGTDPETDLALLKIKPQGDLVAVKLGNSDEILVGDWAIAIGNPFPQLGLDRTVTVGVISAIGRQGLTFGGEEVSYQDYIQTDASINRGNSGGPLVNIRGEVIGINSAIASNTGGSVGIGFAIPINLAKPVIEALSTSGEVSRGWLGVQPQEITKDLAEALNLENAEGVLVGNIVPGSPAEEAGLKARDIITKFNSKKITGLHQFRFLVADAHPKDTVPVEIIRDGKTKKLEVTLGDRGKALVAIKPSGEKPEPDVKQEEPWLGIRVDTFTKEMADHYGWDYEPGVIIQELEPGSPAERQGLRETDVILEIDGNRVSDAKAFNRIIKGISNRDKAILLFVYSGGATRDVAIKPERG